MRTLPKVFLFSKKGEATPLYKAMAAEFEGRCCPPSPTPLRLTPPCLVARRCWRARLLRWGAAAAERAGGCGPGWRSR
jgi:hypothetical protein